MFSHFCCNHFFTSYLFLVFKLFIKSMIKLFLPFFQTTTIICHQKSANFCTRHNFLFISLSLKALVDYYSFVCRQRNNEAARSSRYPVGLDTEKC